MFGIVWLIALSVMGVVGFVWIMCRIDWRQDEQTRDRCCIRELEEQVRELKNSIGTVAMYDYKERYKPSLRERMKAVESSIGHLDAKVFPPKPCKACKTSKSTHPKDQTWGLVKI